ncbi:MAG: hypothetical protein GVX78_02745 [Bacteroidetes bacterium]|jgi:hypothetical protein|nr:hypothetical protein [Bacteroidota bacterium]
MEIKQLKKRPGIEKNKKLGNAFDRLENLLTELEKRELPRETVVNINNEIEQINSFSESEKELKKALNRTRTDILKLLEKELKLVPKNHYRNLWMALGMAVFGVPLGVAFGTSFGEMSFLAIGLPIGMVIGLGVGAGMDKKALEEGRQLDIEN